jgi:hypothetical protein
MNKPTDPLRVYAAKQYADKLKRIPSDQWCVGNYTGAVLITDHNFTLQHRIGFLEGAIEGIRLYAIWRNGDQLVGCLERPLKEVLKPYEEELARLRAKAFAEHDTAMKQL